MGHRIGLAGDWHGNARWARHAIATFAAIGVNEVFQLGDFGLGWPGGWGQYFSEVAGACTRFNVNVYVVPGNHENYDWMDENLRYGENQVARIHEHIYVLGRGFRGSLPHGRTVAALGGAPSIDFPMRMEGRSWWKQEMIQPWEAEYQAMLGHADIMLAHDCPNGATDAVEDIIHNPLARTWWTDAGLNYAAEGRKLMDIAVYGNDDYEGVKPKLFAHGHYHVAGDTQRGDTRFISLNCDGMADNLVVLNLETLKPYGLSILAEIPE